jgi:hypothetical protein
MKEEGTFFFGAYSEVPQCGNQLIGKFGQIIIKGQHREASQQATPTCCPSIMVRSESGLPLMVSIM